MIRFYLDEMDSQYTAAAARRLGLDALSVHDVGREGRSDWEVLQWAAQEQRCVVTRNATHFIRGTRRAFQIGAPHAGVVLVPRSLPSRDFGALATALATFAAEHPDGLPPYTIVWLRRARR